MLIFFVTSSVPLLNHVSTRIKHTRESTAACPGSVHHKAAFLQQKSMKFHPIVLPRIMLPVYFVHCSFIYADAQGSMWWSIPVMYYGLCSALCAKHVSACPRQNYPSTVHTALALLWRNIHQIHNPAQKVGLHPTGEPMWGSGWARPWERWEEVSVAMVLLESE